MKNDPVADLLMWCADRAVMFGLFVVLGYSVLLHGCPPPQVETGAVCRDQNHATCGTCASTRACAWCIAASHCMARDPALGDTCDGDVARVTEACP